MSEQLNRQGIMRKFVLSALVAVSVAIQALPAYAAMTPPEDQTPGGQSLRSAELQLPAGPLGVPGLERPNVEEASAAGTGIDSIAEAPGFYWLFGPHPDTTLTGADPIYMGGAEYRQGWQMFDLHGLLPLDFTLMYAPDLVQKSPAIGGRTQFPYFYLISSFTSNTIIRIVEFEERRITPYKTYANVFMRGDSILFEKDAMGNFTVVDPIQYELRRVGEFYFFKDPINGLVYIFRSRWMGYEWPVNGEVIQLIAWVGEAVQIVDRNGNSLTFTYNADILPTRIEDGLGRALDLKYVDTTSFVDRHLESVSDGQGRRVTFAYDQNICSGWLDSLASFTDPIGRTSSFDYRDPAGNPCTSLTKVTRPLGNSHIDQTWAQGPHELVAVQSQMDANGNETSFTWATEPFWWDTRVWMTNPEGDQTEFLHATRRWPQEVTDQEGNQYTLAYSEEWQMVSMTDRLGDTILVQRHGPSSKIEAFTDAEGRTATYEYAGTDQEFSAPVVMAGESPAQSTTFTFHDLVRVNHPDGTQDDFEYDGQGNVTGRTDGTGSSWSYEYNEQGQVTRVVHPTGGVEEYSYNPDGTLANSTDSDTGLVAYQYDVHKRLSQVDYPDGTNGQIQYNDMDYVTQVVDRRGVATTFEYDANDNLVAVVRAAGTGVEQRVEYEYDLMDRLVLVRDPAGFETGVQRTSWGEIEEVLYPGGAVTGYQYDRRRWLAGLVDPLGGQWGVERDAESVISGLTTPEGRNSTQTTDKLGYGVELTDPLGNSIEVDRDEMERVVGVVDRLNRETTYNRDGEGRVTSIELPVIGTASYSRNGLGLVTVITDQRGNDWEPGYTGMGRLNLLRDPLGNEWHYAYDQMGRVGQVQYPDGITETRTYDGNGNLTVQAFSDGLNLTYEYDELNRLTATGSVPVELTWDERSLITNTRIHGRDYGATFDGRGRVETVTYDGQMTVSYAYDARGLLTEVSDDLTGSWVRFGYDADGLLTSVERSNGQNTIVGRDLNGRLTGIDHGAHGGQQYVLDAEGQMPQMTEDLPTDVGALLWQQIREYSYDAANQITDTGYAYDQRGRRLADTERNYEWDSGDRLVRLSNRSKAIEHEYTSLGDVAERTEDQETTEFGYNYALGGRAPVAERKGGGNERLYVQTPNGALAYSVEPDSGQVRFYHFDQVGSTLFLTDGTGSIIDSYGYTPYGRMVSHVGQSDQPFTYVGEYGVRQEFGTGVYQMGARYYDVETAQFLSRDPIWLWLVGDPRELNAYQYAAQNPVRYIDPFGLQEGAAPDWANKTGGFGIGAQTTLGGTNGLVIRTYVTPAFGIAGTLGFALTSATIGPEGSGHDAAPTDSPFRVGLYGFYKLAYWQRGNLNAMFGFDLLTHASSQRESPIKVHGIDTSGTDLLIGLGLMGEYFPTQYLSLFAEAGLTLDNLGPDEVVGHAIANTENSGIDVAFRGDLLGSDGFTVWFR